MEVGTRRALGWGALSGAAGALLFLAVHHLTLVPVWFLAPVGVPIAAVAGALHGLGVRRFAPGLAAGVRYGLVLATPLAGFLAAGSAVHLGAPQWAGFALGILGYGAAFALARRGRTMLDTIMVGCIAVVSTIWFAPFVVVSLVEEGFRLGLFAIPAAIAAAFVWAGAMVGARTRSSGPEDT